jgi:hypothetical protein
MKVNEIYKTAEQIYNEQCKYLPSFTLMGQEQYYKMLRREILQMMQLYVKQSDDIQVKDFINDFKEYFPTQEEMDKIEPYKHFTNEDYHLGYKNGMQEGAKWGINWMKNKLKKRI